jgi:hypothetical protein
MTFGILCVTLPHVVYVMFCAKEFKIPYRVFMHVCMCRYNVVMISRVAMFPFHVGYFLFWECVHIEVTVSMTTWALLCGCSWNWILEISLKTDDPFQFSLWLNNWMTTIHEDFCFYTLGYSKAYCVHMESIGITALCMHGSYTFGLLHKLGK